MTQTHSHPEAPERRVGTPVERIVGKPVDRIDGRAKTHGGRTR
ncbi:hypothetical protein ACFRMN_15955 [Streptomyces sp. NPDC056835]